MKNDSQNERQNYIKLKKSKEEYIKELNTVHDKKTEQEKRIQVKLTIKGCLNKRLNLTNELRCPT